MVIRNLPSASSSNTVVTQLTNPPELKGKIKILHCSLVHIICEKACVVVTLQNIEEAEALCLHWNNFMFNDKSMLKAHIHPYSSWKRISSVQSKHQIFKSLYVPTTDGLKTEKHESRPTTPILPTNDTNQLKDSVNLIMNMKSSTSLIQPA